MPDVRLIDATRLHAQIFNDNGGDLSKTENVAQILLRIENAQTVDAVPVKYGKWVLQMDGCSLQKCSCCGYEYSDRIECDNFCGNCGADMRPGKTGKWIDRTLHHYYDYPKFICSICGEILKVDKEFLPCECPKCGAKMTD